MWESRTVGAVGSVAFALLLAACSQVGGSPTTLIDDPIAASPSTTTPGTNVPSGVWDTSPEKVPDGVGAPILDGGTLLNALEATDRVIVTISYPGELRGELADLYDEWSSGIESVDRVQGTVMVDVTPLWSVRWEAPGIQVRVIDCIDPVENEFILSCVAITTARG